MIDSEARLATLERRMEEMAARLERVEVRLPGLGAPPPPSETTAAPHRPMPPLRPGPACGDSGTPAPSARPGVPAPARSATAGDRLPLEDLLGGRVLAWIGGVAVALGVAFLFAFAVSRGWIGEAARVLIAAAGSLGLLAVGVWLHEHRGRTDAALAASASAIAALFATIVVAAELYALVPIGAALVLALGVGATATSLAVRWAAPGIAGLGIVGALLAPVLVEAPITGGTLALLFVAGLSAVGVLVWQRWSWLALAAFAVATPQWVAWLLEGPSAAGALLVLVAFGALNVAAAIGFELRLPARGLRPSSSFLLVLNALVLAVAGWFTLESVEGRVAAELWLAGLAAAHLGAGLASGWRGRVSHEIRLLLLGIGVLVADVALQAVLSGPALGAAWAAGGIAFAVLQRRVAARREDAAPGADADRARRLREDEALTGIGLGGHVALALLHAVLVDASPTALVYGGGVEAAAALALTPVAAGCFVSGRLAAGRPGWRTALDGVGLAVVAYLAALALDGPALAVAWAVEAVALGLIAHRRRDEVAAGAAIAHVGLAGAHALAFEAPPGALVDGLVDPLAAALAVGAAAGASVVLWRLGTGGPQPTRALAGAAALGLLHLASTAVVSAFQPGPEGAVTATVLDLGVRQQAQVALSALWSVVGAAALVLGLRRDLSDLRRGALGLLLVTVAKVFLYDLAALGSLYRVASFIALGLVLLAGAFAWQRLRPPPLPDLRTVPRASR